MKQLGLILMLLVMALPLWAKIVFDAQSNTCVEKNVVTMTWDHTCTDTDKKGVLLVGISYNNGPGNDIATMTYGGTAMTKVVDNKALPGVRQEIWSLQNPPSGTAPVYILWHGTVNPCADSISYRNVRDVRSLGFTTRQTIASDLSMTATTTERHSRIYAQAAQASFVSGAVLTPTGKVRSSADALPYPFHCCLSFVDFDVKTRDAGDYPLGVSSTSKGVMVLEAVELQK